MNCTATTKLGRPCRAYAVRDSNPPLCAAHRRGRLREPARSQPETLIIQPEKVSGFYGDSYTVEEIADLVAHAADKTLDDEIAAARVATRRVMAQLHQQLEPAEYGKLARLVFTGANTIARLLTAQRVLKGDSEDGLAKAIETALSEYSKEIGVTL